MGTHSFTQSPSRRGRRIFDFAPELAARQQMFSQMASVNAAAASGNSPFGMLSAAGLPMNFSPLLAAAFAAQQQQQSQHSNADSDDLSPSPSPTPTASSAQSMNPMDSMFWMLRTICTICQKACGSPQELEKHLKTHLTASESLQSNNNNTSSNSQLQLKSE